MLLILSLLLLQVLAFAPAASLHILPGHVLLAAVETDSPSLHTDYKVGGVHELTTWKRSERGSSSTISRPAFVTAPPSVISPNRASSSTNFEIVRGERSPSKCMGCMPGIQISSTNKARLNKVYSKTKGFISSIFANEAISYHKIPREGSGYADRGHRTRYTTL